VAINSANHIQDNFRCTLREEEEEEEEEKKKTNIITLLGCIRETCKF
jgi:hypothetical protein